ncbi:MAG TPA: Gmad2 immunoglobulin-like domain-containing protein [Nocardioidaceae bacterium]|nr:Gmad2 immunoglobulin-like domain-containing protein [Nocardioidaceae bacterium]
MNDHSPKDRDLHDLHDLLQDAVRDVEPRDALDAIRSRTKVTPMHSGRNWLLGSGAAVVAVAAVIIAVVVLGNQGTPQADNPPVATSPSRHASPSTAASASASASAEARTAGQETTVPVYYPGDTPHGVRLYREFHQVVTTEGLSEALNEAVGRAADGGPSKPYDPDYSVPWPSGTTIEGVDDGADQITVNLGGPALAQRPAGMSDATARIAVQQLVYTATAAAQKTVPVRFLIDGNAATTLLGVDVSPSVERGDSLKVLALVWVSSPNEGAQVTSPFTVTGVGAFFEANAVWELKQGSKVVKHGHTTAQECCTLSPYSFKVSAPPGDYTLVVHDSDASGTGRATPQDTKDVTVIKP